MTELMTYGLGAMLVCFAILTFLLNRIPLDLFPENYEFALDPFWYIIATMFLGGTVSYFIFPHMPDMVHELKYIEIFLPLVLASLIYLCFLFNLSIWGNLFIIGSAAVVVGLLPQNFAIFPEHLTLWQDRLAAIAIIFICSKGLGLLNGIGVVAIMQFSAVMITIAFLAHFSAAPYLLGVIALAYLGSILAFLFLNYPPEKLFLNKAAVEALGFIMACLMLSCAQEFAEAPVFIATSYLVTELLFALYDRYINNHKPEALFMNTSYYITSHDGEYSLGVCRGIMKLLFIDIVLAMAQILATDQFALFIFAVLLNFWLLSILSGNTKPQSFFSVTRWSVKTISGLLKKKDKEQNK